MTQQASLAVKVGIVIVVGLILLVGFSLRSSGKGWFYKGYEVNAEFATAKGIERGSQVVLAGVPIGQVESMAVLPHEGKVRAKLLIDEPNRIPADAVGSIRLKTLLGNYLVYITHGSKDSPYLKPGDRLNTEDYPDITEALQSLGTLGKSSEDLFASLQQNQQRLFTQLDQVIAENRASLRQTLNAFAQAGPQFNQLLGTLNQLSKDVQGGKGTLGKLAADDQLYAQFTRITNNLERFSADLNNSQGPLGRLVHDKALGTKIETAFDQVNAASGKVQGILDRNEANIDKALQAAGSALPKLDQGLDHFNSIGRKIDQGQGTLGKLVNDPALYNNLRDTVNKVRRTFEEGEEQGVMRTFLAVFFGSVI